MTLTLTINANDAQEMANALQLLSAPVKLTALALAEVLETTADTPAPAPDKKARAPKQQPVQETKQADAPAPVAETKAEPGAKYTKEDLRAAANAKIGISSDMREKFREMLKSSFDADKLVDLKDDQLDACYAKIQQL